MTKPNLFIVGAPKCGTTALTEYLRNHPNIFISRPKEPDFFSEFPIRPSIRSLDDYMALFQEATSEHLVVGEASVWYLFSSVAIRNIHQFNPKAKIIVMLRNPVDLVYSLHSQLVYNFIEDENDFEVAWRLQAVRRSGQRIPKACPEPGFLQYAQVGKLGDQVERLVGFFKPDQVKVILFDDFAVSTQMVYEDVLSFLEVPCDGRTDFPCVNTRQRHISKWLGKLIRTPPKHVKCMYRLGSSIKKSIGLGSISFLNKIGQLNSKNVKGPQLSSRFRKELVEEFREDIKKLSKLIDRDLTNWYTP